MAHSDLPPTLRVTSGIEQRLRLRYLPCLARWVAARLAPGSNQADRLAAEVLDQALKNRDHLLFVTEAAFLVHLRQELAGRVITSSASPLESAIGTEALRRYDAALLRLRAEDREAVVARIEMGLSYAEAAEALGHESAEAVQAIVSQAVLRLAEEMSNEAR